MMEYCKHCGKGENTHQRLSKTCFHCGLPMRRDVEYVGLTVNLDRAEMFDFWTGRMAKLERALKLKGESLIIAGRQAFVDVHEKVYICDSLEYHD